MAYSITNKEQLGYSAETVWGTTVAASPMNLLRYTGSDGKPALSSVRSKEILNSREVSDDIQTMKRGTGTANVEWSYGMLDDMLQGLYMGAWATNVLQVGSTFQSFSIERQYTDIGQYELYAGSVITGINMNVAPGKVVDGQVSWSSKFPSWSPTTGGTGTTAAPTNAVFDPISSVQLIQQGGAGSIAGVLDFSMNLKQAPIDFPQLQSADPATIGMGLFEASGTISIYWQDATYITLFKNFTQTSLLFTMGGAASKKYAFLFNKVKFTLGENPNPGMNQPMVSKFNWTAQMDVSDSTCQITRTP